jgi:hypothetical protein
MSEQDNLRVTLQTWDVWNAHDIDGALKNLDEKHQCEESHGLKNVAPPAAGNNRRPVRILVCRELSE